MSRPRNIVPPVKLNLGLPGDLYAQTSLHLHSELEERVPHGAYSKFLVPLLREYFSRDHLDLSPWLGGSECVVHGDAETLLALQRVLNDT